MFHLKITFLEISKVQWNGVGRNSKEIIHRMEQQNLNRRSRIF